MIIHRRLTSADKEVLNARSLRDLFLIKSKDVEQRDIVYVNGDANLWRCVRVGASSQESEEDSIRAVVKLLYRVGMDVVPDHVPAGTVSIYPYD